MEEKKTITKFCDIEIKKQIIRQHERPISITNIDINKILASNKVSFGKNGFKYFLAKKMLKLNLYVYFSQK